MDNLWSSNHPRNFWQCQPEPADEIWQIAIQNSASRLGMAGEPADTNTLLSLTLGEGRFGPEHWTLSLPKKFYYLLKPMLPRALTRLLRQVYGRAEKSGPDIAWPVETRYVDFLWEVMRQILALIPGREVCIRPLWPNNFQSAFVLTHDVESDVGYKYIRAVADLEQSLGFRSSFNLVPEGYRIEMGLVDELRRGGFEVGIHGLKHDGKLFHSHLGFQRSALKINRYLKEMGAAGFRAPLTQRNPEWMQALDMEYDLSFFDTDPYEPIPGGVMSIWPFFIGHFVELPYTLVQDYTLTAVLGESTPRIWLEKLDYIERSHGMALLNSHPDYLREPSNLNIYGTFLSAVKEHSGYWHALPRDVATWWRERSAEGPFDAWGEGTLARIVLVEGRPEIERIRIERDEAA